MGTENHSLRESLRAKEQVLAQVEARLESKKVDLDAKVQEVFHLCGLRDEAESLHKAELAVLELKHQ